MQTMLAILRLGNTEILEEKELHRIRRDAETPEQHEERRRAEKFSFEPHYSIIFHFIINLQQWYTFINILVLISTTAIVPF